MTYREVLAEYLHENDISKIIPLEECSEEDCNLFKYESEVYKIDDYDNPNGAFFDEIGDVTREYIDAHVTSSIIADLIDFYVVLELLSEEYGLSELLEVERFDINGEAFHIGKCYKDYEGNYKVHTLLQ